MNIAQPIKNKRDLELFKEYYKTSKPNERNYLLIIMGLNTALRISDILVLRWNMVFDFQKGIVKEHIFLTEQKTGKTSQIYINKNLRQAIAAYMEALKRRNISVFGEKYIFASHERETYPISRVQAFRIIKKAADNCNLPEHISCHSLRKTFGYYAWQQGTSPVMLMNIYNHSSYVVTKRYLGIEQEDRDKVFESVIL